MGQRNHWLSPDRIEQRPKHKRTHHVGKCERQDIPAYIMRWHVVEFRQDERISEEDRVVEERLSSHQREANQRPRPIANEYRLKNFAQWRMRSRVDAHRLKFGPILQAGSMGTHPGFDLSHNFFGFLFPPVDNQPTGAFGQEGAQEKDNQTENSPNEKTEPPADLRVEVRRVQDHN